jgi:hypothetical protein
MFICSQKGTCERQNLSSPNRVILPWISFVVIDAHLYSCASILFFWIHLYSYAGYQNTSHASSFQLPTYPISYSLQCEEGDELAARLAEDGTHYFPLVEAASPFQHCERHLRLLHLHLHQQLHPLPNNYPITLYLVLTISSGIVYLT